MIPTIAPTRFDEVENSSGKQEEKRQTWVPLVPIAAIPFQLLYARKVLPRNETVRRSVCSLRCSLVIPRTHGEQRARLVIPEVDEAPESLDVQELQQEVITFNFEHKGGNLAIPCAISWTSERTIETCLRTNPHLAPTPELIDVIQQLHQTRVRPQLFVALNSLVSQLEERIESESTRRDRRRAIADPHCFSQTTALASPSALTSSTQQRRPLLVSSLLPLSPTRSRLCRPSLRIRLKTRPSPPRTRTSS